MANETPWMVEAQKYLGLTEQAGKVNDANIVGFFAEVGQSWIKDDETAWCAAFAGTMLKRTGYRIPGGVEAVRARAYGAAVARKVDEPIYGDLVLMNYGQKGDVDHVTFYAGPNDSKTFKALGGNQSNKVKISVFNLSDVAGFYRPVKVTGDGPVSVPPPVVVPRSPAPAPETTLWGLIKLIVARLFGRK